MSFRELDVQIRYRSEIHNFPRDFLIPVLSQTVLYKRGTGYFSTTSLIQLSVGLFEMAKNGGRIQIICSPNLDKQDIEAIEYGYRNREKVITESLLKSIRDPVDYFEEERLNLVATLISNGTMDIKLAFLEDGNGFRLYHEKMAVFIDSEGNRISYAGSANESENGLEGNFESIYTFCSWKDQSQIEAVYVAESDFDQMWENNSNKLRIVDFPDAVVEKLMNFKKSAGVNWNTDIEEFDYKSVLKKHQRFRVPDDVILHEYQEKAVQEWKINGYSGIFDMCTGAGKTYTALYGMVQLAREYEDKIAVIIVCPYIHLVSQWEEDVEKWCSVPIIIAHSKSPDPNWKNELMKAYKRFRKDGNPFVCITTNDTFSREEIQKYVTRFNEEQKVLIIVDEAHNFGSPQMVEVMPWNIKNRIALSATIKRHMDKSGTKKIEEFFGEKCIEYSLERAIDEGKLVHYDYIPIPVALSEYELSKYKILTKRLKKYLIIKNGKMKISESGKPIIYQRTRLLAGAEGKVSLLLNLIEKYKDDNNILIYCGAANVDDEAGENVRQIDLVTKKLQTEFNMSVKRFTAEEGLKERQNIKRFFAQGMYQVITAIKCLDEGVNIPGIKTAFIMSSSRNPKEFIQRRGRLLRKSDNKNKATIYDFITLPRELDDVVVNDIEEDKTIIVGEIARMTEFGKLSDNPEVTDNLINQIMTAYDYYFDPDEEMEKMEEYYGD